jgi:hypothetical protein
MVTWIDGMLYTITVEHRLRWQDMQPIVFRVPMLLLIRVKNWMQTAVRFSDMFNPLMPNDLERRRAVSPLKINPSKNMREKPTNTPIIHSVY